MAVPLFVYAEHVLVLFILRERRSPQFLISAADEVPAGVSIA